MKRVDREEAVREDVVQDDVADAAAAVVEGGGVGEWGVAEVGEEGEGGGHGLAGIAGAPDFASESDDSILARILSASSARSPLGVSQTM